MTSQKTLKTRGKLLGSAFGVRALFQYSCFLKSYSNFCLNTVLRPGRCGSVGWAPAYEPNLIPGSPV